MSSTSPLSASPSLSSATIRFPETALSSPYLRIDIRRQGPNILHWYCQTSSLVFLSGHLITFTFPRLYLFERRKRFCWLQLSLISWLSNMSSKEDTMELQGENKSNSCTLCNLSFKTAENLKTHMLQHDGKKQHSCNQCSYSSTKASNMKSHMLVHSGEKPFSCTQCDYSCGSAGNLKRHVLIKQSGEKPFSWTQCSHSSLVPQPTCLWKSGGDPV